MPRPLRKSFQKAAAGEARGLTVKLSRATVAALGLVLVAVVGWAFFMGFMVGRGQNPEKHVEQMTGMAHKEQPAQAPAEPSAENAAGQTPQTGQPVADAASGAEQAASSALSAPLGQTPQAVPQNAPAAPFSRPQGEGLAAWGIRQDATGTPVPATNAAPPPQQAQRAPGPAGRPRTQEQAPRAETLFDFTYQVAAFRGKADADKLRARLEGRGLRTFQQKSGKVLLVLGNLRGAEPDAANLREELQRMKLGKPVLVSKKAVSGKPRKTGR